MLKFSELMIFRKRLEIQIAAASIFNLPFRDAKKIAVEAFERDFVSRKLAENNGNISKAAEALGMHRQSLQQKIKELNMK